jgi:hypothetical protein
MGTKSKGRGRIVGTPRPRRYSLRTGWGTWLRSVEMDRPTNSELLQRFQGNRTVECAIHDQAYFFLAGLGPMEPTGLLESIWVGERGLSWCLISFMARRSRERRCSARAVSWPAFVRRSISPCCSCIRRSISRKWSLAGLWRAVIFLHGLDA